jgi:hypothetical protein
MRVRASNGITKKLGLSRGSSRVIKIRLVPRRGKCAWSRERGWPIRQGRGYPSLQLDGDYYTSEKGDNPRAGHIGLDPTMHVL